VDAKDSLVVALDVSNLDDVKFLVRELAPRVGCFKIGSRLTTVMGVPKAVEIVQTHGGNVFLDVKLHDIPNTVGEAVTEASRLGVTMFTVHASNGIAAMRKAVLNNGGMKIFAVTVLTSLDENECRHIYGTSVKETVFRFARDAKQAGVDGIISSPRELEFLCTFPEFANLLKVTPGVRPS